MDYPHGTTIYRDRRGTGTNPYNPSNTAGRGDWDPALSIVLERAYLDIPSSSSASSATRTQVMSERVLFVPNPDADVKVGDRIRIGGTVDAPGEVWFVNARPGAAPNPFTGTRFPLEVPLAMTEG